MHRESASEFVVTDAPCAAMVGVSADRTLCRVLTGALGLLLALQLHLAATMAINWDEFHFLAQVHAYARGELDLAVNTLHVHLFRWLLLAPAGEINQIVAARFAMLALETGTLIAIVRIAERFVPRWAALAGALAYLSFGNVFVHGPSFRTDPISTFLLMSTLWLMLCSDLRRRAAIAIGMLVALAGLVTIKSAIYLPALAVAAWWRWRAAPDGARVLRSLLLAAAAGALAFVGLYALHSGSLAPAMTSSVVTASSAYTTTLRTGQLFPGWREFERTVLASPLNWAVILLGVLTAAARAVRASDKRSSWFVLAALALPITTLAFYRNAFPYYYAFMLAPAGVVAAVAFTGPLQSRRAASVVLVIMVAGALAHYATYVQRGQQVQRAVVEAVHAMFPRPAPYVERASMIGSFPDVGFFMTTWGMDKYRQEGRSLLSDAAPGRRPVFVIASHPGLEGALSGARASGPYALLPKDAAFLGQNFIPHWGPIWVAGKRIRLDGAGRPFQIDIPGTYTLEARRAVTMDGAPVAPGHSIELAAGAHTLSGPAGDVVLRWGRNLYRPSQPVPPGRLYWGF